MSRAPERVMHRSAAGRSWDVIRRGRPGRAASVVGLRRPVEPDGVLVLVAGHARAVPGRAGRGRRRRTPGGRGRVRRDEPCLSRAPGPVAGGVRASPPRLGPVRLVVADRAHPRRRARAAGVHVPGLHARAQRVRGAAPRLPLRAPVDLAHVPGRPSRRVGWTGRPAAGLGHAASAARASVGLGSRARSARSAARHAAGVRVRSGSRLAADAGADRVAATAGPAPPRRPSPGSSPAPPARRAQHLAAAPAPPAAPRPAPGSSPRARPAAPLPAPGSSPRRSPPRPHHRPGRSRRHPIPGTPRPSPAAPAARRSSPAPPSAHAAVVPPPADARAMSHARLILRSMPGEPMPAGVIRAARPILAAAGNDRVCYISAASLHGPYLELNHAQWAGIGTIEHLDVESVSPAEADDAMRAASLIYITGGNTFALAHRLRRSGSLDGAPRPPRGGSAADRDQRRRRDLRPQHPPLERRERAGDDGVRGSRPAPVVTERP